MNLTQIVYPDMKFRRPAAEVRMFHGVNTQALQESAICSYFDIKRTYPMTAVNIWPLLILMYRGKIAFMSLAAVIAFALRLAPICAL